MIPSVIRGVDLHDLDRIREITRATFPSVKQMDTATLADLMERKPDSVLLLDVRPEREFEVSHLRGAVRAEDASSIRRLAEAAGGREVVLYCAVGFRSSMLAARLTDLGGGGISNLDGSIFRWANEGRPLFCGTQPVRLVHPYGKRWAGLLKPGLASMRH